MSNKIKLTRVKLTEVNTQAKESSHGCLITLCGYSSTYFSNYDFPNILSEEQVVLDKWLLFNVRDIGGDLTEFINLAQFDGITIDDTFYEAAAVISMLNAAEAETNS